MDGREREREEWDKGKKKLQGNNCKFSMNIIFLVIVIFEMLKMIFCSIEITILIVVI